MLLLTRRNARRHALGLVAFAGLVLPVTACDLDAAEGPDAAVASDVQARVVDGIDCREPVTDTVAAYLRGACAAHAEHVVTASEISAAGHSCVPQGYFRNWGCLVLDQSLPLCPSPRPFNVTVVIPTSGVTLDCRGETIDHGWTEGARRQPGVRFARETSLSDVTIRNCRFENLGFGAIHAHRLFGGPEFDRHGTNVDGATLIGHSDVLIENIEVRHANDGVYVGQGSRRVQIRNSTFSDLRMLGIYVEAFSEDVLLRDLEISATGEREAVAIDSASDVLIERSRFHGNGTDVNVYKNCGELYEAAVVCPVERPIPRRNVLRNNDFSGKVAVASRQGTSYGADRCYDLGGKAGRFRDAARGTSVYDNRFFGARLEVLDGWNFIYSNRFESKRSTTGGLLLGRGAWSSLQAPIHTNMVLTNRFLRARFTVDPGADDLAWVRHNVDHRDRCLTTHGNECAFDFRAVPLPALY